MNGRKLIGAAGVVAIVAAGLMGSPRPVQASVAYTRIVHSGPNIADGGTLVAGAPITICIQPQDSNGTATGGTVFLSFGSAFTPGGQPGGTAKVGATALASTPTSFLANAACTSQNGTPFNNAIRVDYVAPSPYPTPKIGRDVLCMANDQFSTLPTCTGSAITNNDVYAFSPVTSYALSPGAPIAAPGSLAPRATATFTVTAFDATANSVPGAVILLSLSGSPAGVAGSAIGVDDTTGSPNPKAVPFAPSTSRFATDQSGVVTITYMTAASASANQVDTITAQDHPSPIVSITTSYGYSACSGTTLVADFSGDSKADAAAVSHSYPCVMTSSGSGFGTPRPWETAAFYGSKATLAGDINGDGKSDSVAVNNGSTWVLLSTGTGFGAPTLWSTTPFYGSVGTYLADVNGDGKADLVAVNNASTWVMLSTGTGFAAAALWSTIAFFGSKATIAGDVTGDGNADLVAVNNGSTWVMVSTGTAFGAPTLWSSSPFYGSKATLAADVTGDGKVDLVAVNNGSTWVMTSSGTGFGAPTAWSSSAFYGSVVTLAGDVTGDGNVDLVAVNGTSTWVMVSTGTAMGPPTLWSTSAF